MLIQERRPIENKAQQRTKRQPADAQKRLRRITGNRVQILDDPEALPPKPLDENSQIKVAEEPAVRRFGNAALAVALRELRGDCFELTPRKHRRLKKIVQRVLATQLHGLPLKVVLHSGAHDGLAIAHGTRSA
eukprot:Amastigsp_a5477_54.p4 type:complete len:133 gc:universal Amastigsp_a5477_54:1194-1592(+)